MVFWPLLWLALFLALERTGYSSLGFRLPFFFPFHFRRVLVTNPFFFGFFTKLFPFWRSSPLFGENIP